MGHISFLEKVGFKTRLTLTLDRCRIAGLNTLNRQLGSFHIYIINNWKNKQFKFKMFISKLLKENH